MTMCASTGVAAARACFCRPAICPGQNGAGTGQIVSPMGNVFGTLPESRLQQAPTSRRHTRRHDTDLCRGSSRAVLVSPTNRRLDSGAQSCGLSLPTFTRERIGIMPPHHIGQPATRLAFAGYRGPRLPIPGRRGPNALAVSGPPKGRLASGGIAILAASGRVRTVSDPSGAPRAGPVGCTPNA